MYRCKARPSPASCQFKKKGATEMTDPSHFGLFSASFSLWQGLVLQILWEVILCVGTRQDVGSVGTPTAQRRLRPHSLLSSSSSGRFSPGMNLSSCRRKLFFLGFLCCAEPKPEPKASLSPPAVAVALGNVEGARM